MKRNEVFFYLGWPPLINSFWIRNSTGAVKNSDIIEFLRNISEQWIINGGQPNWCMFLSHFINADSTFTKELNSSFEKVIADAKEMACKQSVHSLFPVQVEADQHLHPFTLKILLYNCSWFVIGPNQNFDDRSCLLYTSDAADE